MQQYLTVQESQRVAVALVEHLANNADSLDPDAIAEALDLTVEETVRLLAALLDTNHQGLADWLENVLEDQDWDEEL